MNITTIVLIIIGAVVLIAGFVILKKLARKVYMETGYNPFGKINIYLMAAILILPLVVGLLIVKTSSPTAGQLIPMIISAIVPIAVLVVRNLKIKKPGLIVVFSVFQVIGGVLIILFLLIKVVTHTSFEMAGADLSQTARAEMVKDDIDRRAPEYQTGLNDENADRIARENGFRDVKDVEKKSSDKHYYKND